jgi:hypothetical protein
MIVFLVPLKSAKISHSWDLTRRLFATTVQSICNQDCNDFRVLVICHEKPDINLTHPFLEYIQVDFPPPDNEDIIAKRKDKARKLSIGAEFSKKFNPSHLMVVDADDFISNKIASFIRDNPHPIGYFLDNGYVYESGSQFLYFLRKHFGHHCGTSIIINFKLFKLLFDDDIYEHRSFTLIKHRLDLQKLPFYGAIYHRCHGDNIFAQKQLGSSFYKDGDFIGYLKHLSRFRLITSEIKKEFRFLPQHIEIADYADRL